MATATNKQQFVDQWNSHIMEVNSIAHSTGHNLELALEIQKHLTDLTKLVEKVGEILVEDGFIRP